MKYCEFVSIEIYALAVDIKSYSDYKSYSDHNKFAVKKRLQWDIFK